MAVAAQIVNATGVILAVNAGDRIVLDATLVATPAVDAQGQYTKLVIDQTAEATRTGGLIAAAVAEVRDNNPLFPVNQSDQILKGESPWPAPLFS